MQRIARPRRYVSQLQLYAILPVLRYSALRDAYILRFVGETRGPVLRRERRRDRRAYTGPDRRQARQVARASTPLLVDPAVTSRPSGGVRVLGRAEAAARRSEPTPRRRGHGRQRPPRPRH
jgi:hypothetical protein